MDLIRDGFRRQVSVFPEKIAVEEQGLTLTYREFDASSDFVAHTLVANGFSEGRIVAYLGGSGIQRLVALVGAIKAGVPFLPLDERQQETALRDVLEHAGAAGVLLFDELYRPLAESLNLPVIDGPADYPLKEAVPPFDAPEIDPLTIAYFRYTSGSTGAPKGVAVAHRTEEQLVRLAKRDQRFTADDRTALFGHFWPGMALATLSVGGSLYCYDFPAYGPEGMTRWFKENRITIANTYGAIFRAMKVDDGDLLPDLRLLRLSGDLMLRADVEKFERFVKPGTELHNGFGSTECSYIALHRRKAGDPLPADRVPIGFPYEPDHFAIVDADGRRVPQGETGEMVLFSPYFIDGYHNDPARTAAVYRPLPHLGAEIAYFTGDQGYFDVKGVIHPVGRADDQVKIRGYVVRPNEVESLINQFEGVAQAAVTAFEGPRAIRRLACHLVPEDREKFSTAALRNHLREHLPGYMVPSTFLTHDSLPTTSTGKVLRRALLNPLDVQSKIQRGLESAQTGTERALVGIWTDILGHGDFACEDDFFDVGGDSLQAMAMVLSIEKQFGHRMTLETLVLDSATIHRLGERIDGADVSPDVSTTALNRGGRSQALYAVPVMGGHLSDYLALAHQLEGHHAMLGLPFGNSHTCGRNGLAIHDLAGQCLTFLPETGSTSPVIVGYSFGGVIAYEVARQLAATGSNPLLILIDAMPVWTDPLRHVRSIWRAARQGDFERSQRRLSSLLANTMGGGNGDQTAGEAQVSALHKYKPQPLSGVPSMLVVSDKSPKPDETRAEWQRLMGDSLEIATAPGNHFTMMRDPHVMSLGNTIREWLQRVDQGSLLAVAR